MDFVAAPPVAPQLTTAAPALVLSVHTLIDTGRSKLWVVPGYSPDLLPQLSMLPLEFEPPITMMGRSCNQRRNIGFYSDTSAGYKYSGQISRSIPHTELTKWLLDGVNSSLGTKFNGILINQYADGTKYIGAHSDDESALDKTGLSRVAGISFGSTRTFRIRNRSTKQIVLDYQWQSGTLLVMEGDFQKEFTHEIPVQKTVLGQRISVTFRHHTS